MVKNALYTSIFENVEGVSFDCWAVLAAAHNKEPIKDFQRILRHNCGPDGTHPELDPRFLDLCNSKDFETPRQMLEFLSQEFKTGPLPAGAEETAIRVCEAEGFSVSFYPDAEPTVKGVSALGYKTGCITNMWSFAVECIFEHHGWRSKFDVPPVISCKVGYVKPQREIFDIGAEHLGLPPEKCLFVGDHIQRDVEGALNAGWNAVLLDRDGTVDREWRQLHPQVLVIRTLTELVNLLPKR